MYQIAGLKKTSLTYNHIAVHSDGSEWKHWRKHCSTLQQGNQMAHGSPKSPAVAVEGIRHSHWNTTQTHQQVSSCQVTNEEVGGIVEFLVRQNAKQKDGVSNTSNHHYEEVEREEQRLETKKQLHPYKRIQWVAVVHALAFAALQSGPF